MNMDSFDWSGVDWISFALGIVTTLIGVGGKAFVDWLKARKAKKARRSRQYDLWFGTSTSAALTSKVFYDIRDWCDANVNELKAGRSVPTSHRFLPTSALYSFVTTDSLPTNVAVEAVEVAAFAEELNEQLKTYSPSSSAQALINGLELLRDQAQKIAKSSPPKP